MPVPSSDHPTAEPQTLDEIREWYRDIVEALAGRRGLVQNAIRTGSAVASRFTGMTERDLDAWYDDRRRELDRLTVLNLVASAEAELKIDYFRRVGERRKDPLSRAYQKWDATLSRMKRRRPDFDDGGILDVLKSAHVMDNNVIGKYRECLRARHWVGHGRYWAKPVEVDELDPDDVYNRAAALLQSMP